MTNRLKGLFFCLIALSAIFLFSPRIVLADVFLNEFLPNPSNPPDWVELFNDGDEAVDLEGWSLIDSTSEMLTIHEATISAHGFLVFDVSNRLNQNNDQIHLFNQNDEEQDFYEYTSNPGTDVSYGRMPDGGDWGICQASTRGGSNSCVLPTPTPTEEPEETPEPTSTPTPTPIVLIPTPTKKPTPTPTPTLTPTPTGEILGEEATPAAEEATPTPMVLGEETSNPVKLIPFVFIGLGSLLLLVSGGFILSPKLKMKYNHLRKSGEGEKII